VKRFIFVTLLLLAGVVAAQADTLVFSSRQPRSDAELQGATHACNQRVGVVQNGVRAPAAYKECMRSQGWRYQSTTREKTWTDPETGDACHDILGRLGSSCGNF
jgi:hypothetical protein